MRERPYWRAALWLRRHRIRGRQGFIWTIVVLRLALPASLLITLARATWAPSVARHLWAHLLGNSVAGVIGGYVGGAILWALVVNRGGRTPGPALPPPASHQPQSEVPPPRF